MTFQDSKVGIVNQIALSFPRKKSIGYGNFKCISVFGKIDFFFYFNTSV